VMVVPATATLQHTGTRNTTPQRCFPMGHSCTFLISVGYFLCPRRFRLQHESDGGCALPRSQPSHDAPTRWYTTLHATATSARVLPLSLT
jgi:hypothetical protein